MGLVAWCFFLHWVGDFLLQSREMATKKSSEFIWLFRHISIIFIVFILGTQNLKFALFNALIHALIDGAIWNFYKFVQEPEIEYSRLEKREFRFWEDHLFWTFLGTDQLLHGLTIIGLLWLAH